MSTGRQYHRTTSRARSAAVIVTLLGLSASVQSSAQAARAHASMHPKWNETALHSFDYTNGAYPQSGVIRDAQGNLYGTTQYGGVEHNNFTNGVVFKVDTSGNYTTLYTFQGLTDGGGPAGDLVQDAQGNLYGTTTAGGNGFGHCQNAGCGVVFKLDTSGNETVLYTFSGGTDGGNPIAGLVRDAVGNLYGTTAFGANKNCQYGCGVVFKLDTSGNETVLHTFTGGADGAYPLYSDLIRDKQGNLYGVTSSGGDVSKCTGIYPTPGCGVVFKLNDKGKETVLYTFEDGADGAYPQGRLATDSTGNVYGPTLTGGNLSDCNGLGCGVVYKLDRSGNQTVLHTFTGGTDGAHPSGEGVIRHGAILYGTTEIGGSYGEGVVFKLNADTGTEKVLYTFTGQSDGGHPSGSLLRDPDGNLYGTTLHGGVAGSYGTMFELQR